jgi:hypothetical protein
MLVFHPFTLPWFLGLSTLCKVNLNHKMVFHPIMDFLKFWWLWGFQAPMEPKFQYSPTYIGSKGTTFQEDHVEQKTHMGQREMVLGTCWELGKRAKKPLGTKMGNLVRTRWEQFKSHKFTPFPPQIVFWGNEPKNHPKNLLKAKNCQTCGMNESGQCGWIAFDYGQKKMDNEQFLHPLNENELPIFQHAQTQIMCSIL